MNFQKYNLIDSKEKLKALNHFLILGDSPRNPYLALDTETNGLDVHRSTVIGFSLAVSATQGFYVPLLQWIPDPESKYKRTKDKIVYPEAFKKGHLKCVWSGEVYDEFVTPQEYNICEIMSAIPLLLERWVKNSKLLMFNAPFDHNMLLTSFGVDIRNSIALDGTLLLHAIDENDSNALKGNVPKYAEALGINAHSEFAIEKKELFGSIIKNGGNKAGEVWRADPGVQSKYACADAFFTYGICQAALKEFKELHGVKGLKWFFQEEVIPLCKEVVLDMKYRGMYVDAPHFEKLLSETQGAMLKLEDEIQTHLDLKGFPLGDPEEVSPKRLLTKIIELEGLEMPFLTDKKTNKTKPSLAKGAVKIAYQKNPHWLFGHILGEDEMKYSPEKITKISKELHYYHLNLENRKSGKPLKRYRFNINSDDHLRWLFVERLGLNPKILPKTDGSTKEKVKCSMQAEVLKEFMLPKFSWIQKLLSYKKLLKLESTYIRPVVRMNQDGWVYPGIKQNGTGSGRFSMNGINLMTLPRADDETRALTECEKCGSEDVQVLEAIAIVADVKCQKCGHLLKDVTRPSVIKEGFIAPPGYKIVAADFTSLEAKCFAAESGSDSLKEVYHKGLDLYSHVYNLMFDRDGNYSAHPDHPNFLKRVAKDKRDMAKVICLAIPYGSGDGQVANAIGATIEIIDEGTGLPIKIPNMKEGKRVRDLYLSTFPELKAYMEQRELEAVTQGWVVTMFGRRRNLPKAKVIQAVLAKNGMDFQDLEGCQRKSLLKKDCSPISKKTGVQMRLTSEMMGEIQKRLHIKNETMEKKGQWALVRGLLKSDLNLAKNHPIQGLAASITNQGMLTVDRELKRRGLDARVCLQVHDEIIIYAREDQAEEAAEILQQSMEKNPYTDQVSVPMEAVPVIACNLKEAK